ncbi:acyl-CoA N-acyltransferase [Cokeromyces recurvatus]|uniref:acyl-CoA N-acyltransferase n=1 Tax=Cokeromyces recurvatus TaxID=90255 RepID=UPI00221E75CE|nr:acyl-CoA N-acyltransferase [Cokeromyces recurvatus]KAI7898856.1 acyl-CoA N-acyltransferase [Cokeromyces recurvatus]
MTVPALRKYVILFGKIVKLEDFMEKEGRWLSDDIQNDESNIPESCVAIYYKLDIENKTIKERLFMTTFNAKYIKAFKEISVNWIEEYFVIEEKDLQQLNKPEETIIENGGEIFSLINKEGVVVGVSSMIIESDGTVELGKMGVKKAYQGKGYAHPLIYEAISWAKRSDKKFPYVKLCTSSKLIPAINLYKKYGFENMPIKGPREFARGDVMMKLKL